MCNVCCASDAIRDTAIPGGSSRFWWNPDDAPPVAVPIETLRARARRRRAIRIENVPPTPTEPDPSWPTIYLQATGEAEGVGCVRASFDNVEWTAWAYTTDVASIVGALGVDIRWSALSHLRFNPAPLIVFRDLAGIERLMQRTGARDVRFDAGLVDGRAASRKRTQKTMLAAISESLRKASDDELNLSAYLAAFACGLRPRRPVRRRRPRKSDPINRACRVCGATAGSPCVNDDGTAKNPGVLHGGRVMDTDGPITIRHTGKFSPDGGAILEAVKP